MRRLLKVGAGVLAIAAFAAVAYGGWLVGSVDREFVPRGVVGMSSLLLASILGGFARDAWRHSN